MSAFWRLLPECQRRRFRGLGVEPAAGLDGWCGAGFSV